MCRFLAWWFQQCRLGVIELGWIDPATKNWRFRRFDLEDWESAAAFAADRNREACNVYTRVSTIDANAPPGRTLDVHVLETPGVWGDIDNADQMQSAIQTTATLKPLGWVVTGRVPTERVQPYFRLAEPLQGIEQSRLLNRRVAKCLGSDPAVVNPSRLMRLPGTVAWPMKAGRVAELTEFHVTADDQQQVYHLHELERVLSQLEGPDGAPSSSSDGRRSNAGAGSGAGGLGEALRTHIATVSQLIADIQAGRSWHNNMIRLVAHWVGRGWSNVEILGQAPNLTLPDYTVEQTRAEMLQAINGARNKWGIQEPAGDVEGNSENPRVPLTATGLNWEAMHDLPPREWVYGHFLIKQFVSLVGAPGGAGKTAYAMLVALCVALGVDLLGEPVHESGPVWIYNLEDPQDELLRRIRAACLHYGLKRDQLEGRVFLNSGRDCPLVIAKADRDGNVVTLPVIEELIAEIRRLGIKLLVIDPFIRSHALKENSNDDLDAAMALWAQVAQRAGCAVLLVHHFRKGGVAGEAASFRGGSSLIDAARAALTLAAMSDEEAQRLGIEREKRWQFIRADNAKLNLAPPPEQTTWLQLVSVDLGNGYGGRPSDRVQTVVRWAPPSAWEGMPMEMVVRVLGEIDAGPSENEFYALAPQARSRWAGNVLVTEAQRSEAQAKTILKAWKDSGVLEEGQYPSPARNHALASCVRVNQAKLAEMRLLVSGTPH